MRAAPLWRHALLGCLAIGLALAPALTLPAGWPLALAGVAAGLMLLHRRGGLAPLPLVATCALALFAGLGVGDWRLRALDGRALAGPEGERVHAVGFAVDAPRELAGATRFTLQTPQGRVGVAVDRPVGSLPIGSRVAVTGLLRAVEPWLADLARRRGWREELHAHGVRRLPGGRDGLAGTLDLARERADAGIGAGLDAGQASLARGFVLGQDESIAPIVRDTFRRSGLAHLLAVSGQNVMLLAVLAGVLLAALGLPPRVRLLCIVLAIAVYVPIAGGGPSIQRAAVMGVAAIVAGLLGRAADRAWAVLAAAALTLLLNPLAATDVGWQLSFAAVIGIALWARRLATLLAERLAGTSGAAGRRRRLRARLARPVAEAAGITAAATLATAPLIAHTFGTFSVVSLPANLAVAPAVAPVMWLGMVAAALGQVPALPTEPLAHLSGPLLDYIAAVARVGSAPAWSSLPVSKPGVAATIGLYAALGAGMPPLLGALERRRAGTLARSRRLRLTLVAAAAGLLLLLLPGHAGDGWRASPPIRGRLRITALDVGQGDAILLQQPARQPLLIDTGPPGAGLVATLRGLGVDRVDTVLITHPHLDHYGGFGSLVDSVPVRRLVLGRPVPVAAAEARSDSIPVVRVGTGSVLRQGRLRLDVLYPPAGVVPSDPDPNASSLVVEAHFGPWSALLTGDAEQEASGLEPGPFDVLKVAHHGSSDTGLEQLLERSGPRLALISVGLDNDYGHPDADTLTTLAAHGVCALRTDLDGDVGVEVGAGGLRAFAEHGIDGARPGCAGL